MAPTHTYVVFNSLTELIVRPHMILVHVLDTGSANIDSSSERARMRQHVYLRTWSHAELHALHKPRTVLQRYPMLKFTMH